MDTYTHISQVEAQILNDHIAHTYGVKVGWVKLYGKKNCDAIAKYLISQYSFSVTASELLEIIRR